MQTILVLILILFLGYAGAHLHFYQAKIPLGTRYVLFAGSEYLFLGLILSTAPLAILTPDVTLMLSPIINMGLGWIGLLFGIQFEWAKLKRIPLAFMGITLIQALFTLLLAWFGLKLLAGYFNYQISGISVLLLAGVASLSSSTCLMFMRPYQKFPQTLQRLVHYISSLDSLVGMIVLAAITSLWSGIKIYEAWSVLPLYLLLALFLILIFHLFIRFRIGKEELLILTAGLVVFSSGLAGAFGLSALVLNFILGVGLINLPSLNHQLFADILHGEEKPLYIIFLVLAGAMWQPLNTDISFLFAYLFLHIAGKLLGGVLSFKVFSPRFSSSKAWGLSLCPQGGMGIAIAVDYIQYHPGKAGTFVLNIVLAATIITQWLGPMLLKRGLKVTDK